LSSLVDDERDLRAIHSIDTFPPPTLASNSMNADEFAVLRARWADILVGRGIDPGDEFFRAGIAALSREAADARPALPIAAPIPSITMRQSYQRLRTMAVAYRTPGTAQYMDDAVVADIVDGLELLHSHAFHEGVIPSGNWWDWEIGASQALQDIMVLLYDRLSPAQRDSYLRSIARFVPDPALQQAGTRESTGANRSDLCRVVIVNGILARDGGEIARGAALLAPTFAWAESGDGLHRDGSFIQHQTIAYTGAYGLILLEGLANLFALLAGSPWEIDHPDRHNIYLAALNNYAPLVWNGLVFDAVRGRVIVRSYRPDHRDGRMAAAALLRLAEGAPRGFADRYRAAAKGWIQRSTYQPFEQHAWLPQLALAKPVLVDDAVQAAPEPLGHRQFPDMERVVHRRPGWAFVISMCSARTAYYEGGFVDNENLRGWHTGAGMTNLYLDADPGQYADGYWPTVDPYRLPGTTVDTLRLASGDGDRVLTGSPWSGGVTLHGHGTAGLRYEGLGTAGAPSGLRATKSWFCFDDAVVALGAGITASDGRTVQTTLENRNLHETGDAALAVDGRREPSDPSGAGWTDSFAAPRWAHLECVAGYLFLDPTDRTVLHVQAETRTGSHRDVGPTDPSDAVLSRRYRTLWLDHGTDPSDAGYAYAVLPGASVEETEAHSRRSPFEILANTAAVQAVRTVTGDGVRVTAAHFFQAGAVAGIAVDGPCALLVHEHGGRTEVAVSDPSRTVETLVAELPPGVKTEVHVGGSRGGSHTVGALPLSS
jgi:hyaluronate lyase